MRASARAVTVVALCLCVLLPAMAAADHHESALMEEVRAIGDFFSKAMAEDDFEGMLSMYTEDAISLPNYGPRMQGLEAFRKQHAQMEASGMKIHSFESDPTEAWECGTQVIEVGTFHIKLEMPGMGEIEDKGKYVTVYERNADGALKVKLETWNTDMDPMAMMGTGGNEDDGDHEEHSEHEGHGE